jgi:hypothetical protein
MKLIARALLGLLFAVSFLPSIAAAQAAPVMRVQVPFAFTVGKKTLPAGEYWIFRSGQYRLTLRNARQEPVASIMTVPAQRQTARTDATLEFYVAGGEHQLMRVWQANARYGSELFHPRETTALAKAHTEQVQASAAVR